MQLTSCDDARKRVNPSLRRSRQQSVLQGPGGFQIAVCACRLHIQDCVLPIALAVGTGCCGMMCGDCGMQLLGRTL